MNTKKPEITKVKLIDIISPCKYTVLTSRLDEARLRQLESGIANSWPTETPFFKGILTPKPSTYVAVKDEKNMSCKRGYVQSVVGTLIEIFLCDYGKFVVIEDLKRIIPLEDHDKLYTAFNATLLVIPGLVPASTFKFPSGEKIHQCSTWSQEAHSLLKSWFTEADVAMTVFSYKKPTLTFGDLYRKNDKKSLSTYLCERKLAMVNQTMLQDSLSTV